MSQKRRIPWHFAASVRQQFAKPLGVEHVQQAEVHVAFILAKMISFIFSFRVEEIFERMTGVQIHFTSTVNFILERKMWVKCR